MLRNSYVLVWRKLKGLRYGYTMMLALRTRTLRISTNLQELPRSEMKTNLDDSD